MVAGSVAPPTIDSSQHTTRHWTLQDRLAFITPLWKPGGSLDYSHKEGGIFRQGAQLLEKYHRGETTTVTSVAQLAHLLEHQVGFDAATDLDAAAMAALPAMLAWRIPRYDSTTNNNPAVPAATVKAAEKQDNNILLLVLSFGAKKSCHNTTDCPYGPGATNELLAATAARFAQQQQHAGNNVVRIWAQWEVATALWQNHADTIHNNS